MTIDEFIERAAQLDGWYLKTTGAIRRKPIATTQCPLTAVYNAMHHQEYDPTQFMRVGEKLGLNPVVTSDIARAADNIIESRIKERQEIRNKLIQALGL